MEDIFALSDRAVEELADADPMLASFSGIPGRDHRWPDLSPAGHAARRTLRNGLREAALQTEVETPQALLAKQVLVDDLTTEIAQVDSDAHLRDLNSIESGFQSIKTTFDIMPTATRDDWSRVIVRLETIARPAEGYRSCLAEGLRRGLVVARRQVEAVIEEGRFAEGPESSFSTLVTSFVDTGIDDEGTRDRLERAATRARSVYGELTDWLEAAYLPAARLTDPVGREQYVADARMFLGTDLAVEDTYEWGWSEIERLCRRMEEVCAAIDPTQDIETVVTALDSDPVTGADTPEAFIATMQQIQEDALAELAGVHFDVPDQIRSIDVKVAPAGGSLAPYYTPPSEDFSRPGTVWYPLGSRTFFPYWSEITTAYHEGFPGHHLQVGVQFAQGDSLSRYHRLLVWQPGSGEGWALYAEHLMGELGYLANPAHEAGLLAAQLLRACRVVIDIGTHCELPIPADAPLHAGEAWSFETAVDVLRTIALQPEEVCRSEVTRYCGWPGQAISYKVGERVILDLREEMSTRPEFDLRAFHTAVLSVGSIGLDLLKERVLAD